MLYLYLYYSVRSSQSRWSHQDSICWITPLQPTLHHVLVDRLHLHGCLQLPLSVSTCAQGRRFLHGQLPGMALLCQKSELP
jgi:hypothetical protein